MGHGAICKLTLLVVAPPGWPMRGSPEKSPRSSASREKTAGRGRRPPQRGANSKIGFRPPSRFPPPAEQANHFPRRCVRREKFPRRVQRRRPPGCGAQAQCANPRRPVHRTGLRGKGRSKGRTPVPPSEHYSSSTWNTPSTARMSRRSPSTVCFRSMRTVKMAQALRFSLPLERVISRFTTLSPCSW